MRISISKSFKGGRWKLRVGPLKPSRRKGGDLQPEPVESPKPNPPLSGGAAAELEFDD